MKAAASSSDVPPWYPPLNTGGIENVKCPLNEDIIKAWFDVVARFLEGQLPRTSTVLSVSSEKMYRRRRLVALKPVDLEKEYDGMM